MRNSHNFFMFRFAFWDDFFFEHCFCPRFKDRRRLFPDKRTGPGALFASGKFKGTKITFPRGSECQESIRFRTSLSRSSEYFPRFIFEHFKNIRNVIIHFAPCLCRAFRLFISPSISSGVVKCTLKFGSGRHKPSCSASSSARANFSAPSLVVMCTLVKMLDVAIVCLRFDLLRILYRIRIIFCIGEIGNDYKEF